MHPDWDIDPAFKALVICNPKTLAHLDASQVATGEGGAATQVDGRVEASCQRQVGPGTATTLGLRQTITETIDCWDSIQQSD